MNARAVPLTQSGFLFRRKILSLDRLRVNTILAYGNSLSGAAVGHSGALSEMPTLEAFLMRLSSRETGVLVELHCPIRVEMDGLVGHGCPSRAATGSRDDRGTSPSRRTVGVNSRRKREVAAGRGKPG
jgi:hypothetical protein